MAGRPKNSTVARLPISKEELDSLMYYVKCSVEKRSIQDKLYKAFTLLYHSGMRASELMLLNYQHISDAISMGRFSLNNQTKTKKTRLIMISKQGSLDLKELFEFEVCNENIHEKIFRGTKQALIRLLNTHIHECLGGLYSSHSFRQGYVTSLLKVAPASKVCRLVGHSSVQTTLRYDYTSETDMKDVLEMVR